MVAGSQRSLSPFRLPVVPLSWQSVLCSTKPAIGHVFTFLETEEICEVSLSPQRQYQHLAIITGFANAGPFLNSLAGIFEGDNVQF